MTSKPICLCSVRCDVVDACVPQLTVLNRLRAAVQLPSLSQRGLATGTRGMTRKRSWWCRRYTLQVPAAHRGLWHRTHQQVFSIDMDMWLKARRAFKVKEAAIPMVVSGAPQDLEVAKDVGQYPYDPKVLGAWRSASGARLTSMMWSEHEAALHQPDAPVKPGRSPGRGWSRSWIWCWGWC